VKIADGAAGFGGRFGLSSASGGGDSATAPPDLPTQKLILSKAAENLVNRIHKLPDFFAQETTTRFHDLKISYLSPASAPIFVEHQAFQPWNRFSDTVSYREGKEVEEASGNQTKIKPKPKDGLVNLVSSASCSDSSCLIFTWGR